MEKKNNDQKRGANRARLQLALSEIMNGYLFLDEAVQKYEVPASTIIQHLKKIQKEKKDALQLKNSSKLGSGFGHNDDKPKG